LRHALGSVTLQVRDSRKAYDCLIVGGGPAGLTAAIYLARFHLSVLVLHDRASRAALIPATHNHAGFPDGIAGPELLRRMDEQARRYGANVVAAKASTVEAAPDGFIVGTSGKAFAARSVLLATGVVNRRLPMSDVLHDEALKRGLLRYCPICDGYEVTDRNIAVIGTGGHALREAEFLRSYSARVTLVAPHGKHALDETQISRAREWGIALLDGPCANPVIDGETIGISSMTGMTFFDTIYVGLGTDVRSELAVGAGAKTSQDGCILVDSHQETSISGLYSAGDVVLGLDQISNAMGQAGVAATAIRNWLCAKSPLKR
jgi:thioredoxin reductase (NADPH)